MKYNSIIYLLCLTAIMIAWRSPAKPGGSFIEKNSITSSDSNYLSAQAEALLLLKEIDTTIASTFWPNIKPAKYYSNVEANVLNPNLLYQGIMTNFCGYAAFTNYMLLHQPKKYVQLVLDLYRNGEAICNGTSLNPSEAIKKAAGTLYAKGILDIHYADQLLFLTLADHFKGYMNVFNFHYDAGDEDNLWASTTLAKFDRMMKRLLGVHLKTRGSDLLRPGFMSRYRYIKRKMKNNDVILYVNSHFLNPSFKHFITLRVPTHYIHLYGVEKRKKKYILTYWDYGLKTQQAVTQKMFDKLIFGIICINKNEAQ